MLTKLRIKNFKCLADTGELDLRPLTLLIGPNSSGKSSLLQALLMIKETALSGDMESPLTLPAPYPNVGSYPEFIFQHDLNRTLELEIQSEQVEDVYAPIWGSERHARRTGKPRFASPFGIEKVSVRAQIGFSRKQSQLVLVEVEGELHGVHRKRTQIPPLIWKAKVVDDNLAMTVCIGDEEIKDQVPKHLADQVASRKFYDPSLPFVMWDVLSRRKELPRLEFRLPLLPQSLAFLFTNAFEETFKKHFVYIGPIREPSHRYYEVTGEIPDDVGLRGERAVLILYRTESQEHPPRQVLEPVNKWLKELDIAAQVSIEPLSPPLFRLTLTDIHTGTPVNLADVGFGASQVLPIIVQGYFQPAGSMLLLEQPEIHLHARSQAILGDILMEIARNKRRLIVETHSQHMIARIQRRIAEGAFKREDLALYYFEPTEDGTKIREIQLDEYGHFAEGSLPQGFFLELYEDSSKHFDAVVKAKKNGRKAGKKAAN